MRRALLLSAAAGLLAAPAAQGQPYGATYAPNPLSCMTPGQETTHKVGLTNTGTNYWTLDAPTPYRLAYHWFQGATAVVFEGDRTVLPKLVGSANSPLPNSVTLDANLTAPTALGTYTLQWDMVHETVTWFSWQGVPTGDQTVEVKASCPTMIGNLCAKIDCGGLFAPAIDQVVPFVSNPTPGGALLIAGAKFGEAEGKVWIRGLRRWNGAPFGGGNGDVQLQLVQAPGEDHWSLTSVLARIPASIAGVVDQKVDLQLETKAGLRSNRVRFDFKAARETRVLPFADPAVRRLHCGTESTCDWCNGWADPDDDFESLGVVSVECYADLCGGSTLLGSHRNRWHGTDSDTDLYEIVLKNGWVFDSMVWHVDVSAVGEAGATQPEGFAPEASYWKPHIPYWVTYDDDLCYGVDVFISGPKGVPWR